MYAGFTVSVYFNVIVNLLSYFAVGFGTRSCFPFWGEVICWLPGGLGAPKISNDTLILFYLLLNKPVDLPASQNSCSLKVSKYSWFILLQNNHQS